MSRAQSEQRTAVVTFWLLAALVAALAGIGAFRPVDDPDLFWHLKLGEWILEHRAIPRVDEYSFTFAGRPFTADWLAELVMAVAYNGLGQAGLFLVSAVLAAGAMLMVALRMRSRHTPVCLSLAVVLLLLVYDVSSFRFTPRPQTFPFVLLGALLWLCEAAEDRKDLRLLFALPLLIALWTNLHISSTLALAFLFAMAAGHVFSSRMQGRPSIAPHGPRLLLLAVLVLVGFAFAPDPALRLNTAIDTLFFRKATVRALSEWHAPSASVWLGPAGALLALTLLSAVVAWRRWRAYEVLVCAMACWLGFRHIRFLPVMALVIGPVAYRQLATAWSARMEQRPRWAKHGRLLDACLASAMVAGVAVGSIAFDAHSAWLGSTGRPKAQLVGISYPVGATRFIATERPQGAMYNTFHFGGYLMYHLAPTVRVFIDGRTGNLYDEAHFSDMMQIRQRWQEVFSRWKIEFAITQAGELDEPLAKDPRWALVYFDDAAFVFVREAGPNAVLAQRLGYRELLPPFASAPTGDPERMARMAAEAERAVAAAPSSSLAHILRGRVRGMRQDMAGFEADMRAATVLDPNRPEPWQRLGLLALSRRQPGVAIENLGRAVILNPRDESLRIALAAAHVAAGDRATARATLQPLVRADRTLDDLLSVVARAP